MQSITNVALVGLAFWIIANAVVLWQISAGTVSTPNEYEVNVVPPLSKKKIRSGPGAAHKTKDVAPAKDVVLMNRNDPAAQRGAVSPLVEINRSPLRFVAIGDWGGPGREPQRNVAAAMQKFSVRHAVAHPANGSNNDEDRPLDFIVSTGDNMYEDGVDTVKDMRFRRNFESVYVQPSLQVRWYMSLGNHDHGAHGVMRDVTSQVNYTKLSKKWFMPATFYTQEFRVVSPHDDPFTLEIIVLDTYDTSPRLTRISKHQLEWFRSQLQRSTADWRIVVGHRPIFSGGTKHGSSAYMQQNIGVHLEKYGVAAYLCGDDHQLQVLEHSGIAHVLSGGGARANKQLKPNGVRQTLYQAPIHGFVLLELNSTALTAIVVDQRAEEKYRHTWPRRRPP